MTAAELYHRLLALGLYLSAEDGDVLIDGPTEVLDEALIDQIRAHKTALLDQIAAQHIKRRTQDGDCPLSAQQQRLWFLDQLDPGSAAYNVAAAYRMRGVVDVARLQGVLDAVVARHAALRTEFIASAGVPVQRIAAKACVQLEVTDLSDQPNRVQTAQSLAAAHAARRFDLSAGPLLRVALIRLGAEDHVLAINMHHIISDGWSLGVMMRDVAQAYAGMPLSRPALDYADYAAWQQGAGHTAQQEDLRYWQAHLADAPMLSTPETDTPRPALPSHRGARIGITLDAEVTERLRGLATRHGGTLFMVLLAAMGAVLSRHLRASDLCIGTPVANRTRPGLDDVIGFFVNMLPMRLAPEADLTLGTYVDAVRETVMAAFAHQDLPFDRLIEALGVERQLSHAPLFQTVLALQNASGGAVNLPGLSLEPLEQAEVTAQYDLSIMLSETPEGGLTGALTWAADLFDQTRMGRLAGHFTTFLHAMSHAKPTTPLRALNMLGLEETVLLNGTLARGRVRDRPRDGVLRIAELARDAPDLPAVVCKDETLTRGQLNARADALARALQDAGLGIGDVVGVYAGPTVERIVAVLAVARAGACLLPLEPGYPAERLRYMARNAACKVIIGRDLPFAAECPVLGFAALPGKPNDMQRHPDAPAYVIYTSGSTGQPKGVAVPVKALENLVAWQTDLVGLKPGTRVSAMARFGFDGSIYEIWPTLVAGGVLVLAPKTVQDDAAQLLAWWADQRLDVSFMATPLAELAMAQGTYPKGLRWLLTGGDRLRQAPPADAPFELINLYGPTETTVIATAGTVASGDAHLSIGRPIDNLRTYLLGPDLSPVPIGAVGVLHVAGLALAQGYVNRPGQTAAAFLPDPFGPPGARMYDTGDLARYLPDGRLAYLGRADSQISLRGYRIEPSEVEAALRAASDGCDALVIADGGRLLGYVLTEAQIDPDLLRVALARDLPDYMLPDRLLALAHWPLTANGKLDRAALPRPDAVAQAYAPPETPTERILADLWQEVLNRPRIGRHDGFFALGGHSLLATQAVARIRETFGVDLPLRRMFEARTLAALAAVIDAAATEVRTDKSNPLGPRGPDAPKDLPLSHAQRRLWFLDQLEPGNPFYAIPATLRIHGTPDVAALRATLAALGRRHESLRTTFAVVGGVPVQRIAPEPDIPLAVVDLSATPEQAEAYVARAANAPFDLTTGPLVRVSLLTLGKDDHLLVFNMHHIVSDGWSMGVMIRDVGAIYAALSQGSKDPLPPLPVQYPDFALWQNRWLTGDRLRREEEYWRAQLDDLPAVPVQLPLDRPRPAAQSHRGATHSFALDHALAGRLRRLAQSQGATLFMVLNAAYAVLLSRMSGQDDIVIGSPIANRRQPALEQMVGFFVNTLVLRHRIDPGQTFEQLLQDVRQTALAAYDHQDLPFEHLVDLLNPQRDLGHAPVFQISFALQNMPTQSLDLPGLSLRPADATTTTAKFDLTLTVFEMPEGALQCDAEYATDLFDKNTIERFARDYASLLRALVASPDTALGGLALTDTRDMECIAQWNDTGTDTAAPDVADAIARVAARQPDATAVIWEGTRTSYGALDRAANRLAHALRSAGVGAGTLVGLGTGRGTDHIIAGLAILRAGGAFVMLPLDAPTARLHHILSDTGLRQVVGTSDRDWPDGLTLIDPHAPGWPETPPPPVTTTRAYVVYTSGTTGQPKGSVNTRQGLANLCHWYGAAYELGPGSVVSAVANIAFDGILPEIWPTLTHGATLVLVPEDTLRDPWLLLDLLEDTEVDTLYLPMGYLEAIGTSGLDLPASLRRVLAGGDRMKGYLLPPERGLELINLYGPSEVQSISTVEAIGPDHSGPVAIGRPIPNVRVYILDRMLNTLPPGAVGEICIAGLGVGEGYLNLPALTAEKFVPDPFGAPGASMYCSGDLGRFLPDGRIDFVGRNDGQLKIRGFRIELAEIETALLEQEGVAEAAVITAPRAEEDTRLIGYVVPKEVPKARETHWQSTFDQIYADEAPVAGDPLIDIIGWTDSYTGAPIPPAEMTEWLEQTVAGITALRPRNVLEVGVGTGMILHRIAHLTESYVATDLSPSVLDRLSRNLSRHDTPIALHHAPAEDWAALKGQRFDTVILNSVAQYFPSLDYLEHWLDKAVDHVSQGSIFLGDIRNLGLAEAFALSVIDAGAAADTTIGALRGRLARDLAMEPELLVDPAWFFAQAARHSRITDVAVRPKRGDAINELTRFRYDVVLTIDGARDHPSEDWIDFKGLDPVAQALKQRPARLALRHVPDIRTHRAAAMSRLLRDLPTQAELSHLRAQAAAMPPGIALDALDALASEHGYQVAYGFGAGGLNAVLWRDGTAPYWSSLYTTPPRVSARHGNVPYQTKRNAALLGRLNDALATRLPSYMVPSSIVVLDRLPLTANGKLDRRALPVPVAMARGGRPEGAVAVRVAEIWAEVLGLPVTAVGLDDTFFALGGHSLLATQVISRLRAAFGVELPLRALFEQPTLAGLAPVIEAAMAAGEGVAEGPVARHDSGPAPLSFAQQRLWFLDQLAPGDTAYALPMALRLEGPLDAAALRAALNGVVARHAALRTRFALQDGAPMQIVDPAPRPLELPLHDLSDHATQDRALAQALEAEAAQPFDLATGPLLRAALYRLGPEQHVVSLNLHHIVSDGWSMGVLLREMTALYEAHLAGADAALPPLPVQYADYARWQRDTLKGALLERQLAFWQRRLAGLPGLLALPTDRPRAPQQSHRGAALGLRLDAGLTAGLERLAQRRGATLHMVLTGVLSVLLARWSGQDDIAVGTPVAGRRHAALEGLIGFFVNTLVLRTHVDGDEAFGDLLERVRDDALAGLAHQDLPFEQLVEALSPARDLSHAPLFQVMLALQNAPLGEMGFGGLHLSPMALGTQRSKFDLTLSFHPDPEAGPDATPQRAAGLSGTLEYATDLFDAATMARFAEQFVHLARAVVRDPGCATAALPLMDATAQAQTVAAWAARPAPAPQADTLDRLFAAAAARYPDNIALRFEGQSTRYAALDAQANRLAHALIAQGAGPERLIGICTERGPGMILAILGVLKTGAAYLPLDPDHPDDRLAWMLADAAPTLVLADPAQHDRLAQITDLPLLAPHAPPEQPDTPPTPTATPDTLAYVIYTSGSTGRPKGVMVAHANVARLFSATDAQFGFGPDDVWTLFHSHAFDFSVWEIFGALLHGGRLVIVPWLTSRDPQAFHRMLSQEQVTVLNQTPSAFGQLARHLLSPPDPDPLYLRWVIFGGEALNLATLQPWFDAFGPDEPTLVNMYGITETTVHVTHQSLNGGTVPGSIGKAITDLSVRVLDAAMNPVPPGITGEIYVAGVGLARGYLNRPDLTAARFLPDPYGPPGSRMYWTGDLAQVLSGGALRYIGRSDTQVKIRGFRIETAEVEAELLSLDGVSEAVVDVRGERLVAWHRSSWNETTLHKALAVRLPGYMVPATFVAVEAIPLTPNGKVNRTALPDPATEVARPYAAPRNAREAALTVIWQEVLGQARVGIDDNFFVIGGDSLRAVTVAAQARAQGIELTLDDLFRHQTIARLSGSVTGGGRLAHTLPALSQADAALLPPGVATAWPLTRLQLGMIFHAEADADAALYHDVFSFHLSVDWDEVSFRAALQTVAARHPMLRAEFDLMRFSRPLQLIHDQTDIPLTVTDISTFSPDAQAQAIGDAVAVEKATPFERDKPPYIRLHVHLRAASEIQVTLGFHHAILDGWSVATLQVELLDTWARLRAGDATALPPLQSDFAASIAAEARALEDPSEQVWWREAMLDQTPLQLLAPKDRPGTHEPQRFTVDPSQEARLRKLAQDMGVPLRSVLLAAHLRVMAMWGGLQDVTTGLVTHTRTEAPDAEKVLGLFLNTLPLRLQMRDESWRALITRIFDAERALTAHRFYPLAQIVEDLGQQVPFDVVFNYIDFRVHDLVKDGATQVLDIDAHEATNFAFGVTAVTGGGALSLTFAHDAARVDGSVVRRIAADFARVLDEIAADPMAIARVLPAPQERAALALWSGSKRRFDTAEKRLDQLVAAMAARHPDNTALRFEGQSIRYAELDAQANRLAHRLIAQGAGPERIVGICAERGPGMILAILAVLKTGAAYLPLDPDNPDDRMAWMLKDAGPMLVLADPAQHSRLAKLTDLPLLDAAASQDTPDTPPAVSVTPDSLAYVIYTSGSTGKPKGVMVAHRAIVNRMLWQKATLSITPHDRIVQKTPYGFDVSVSEIFLPLIAGASLIIARPGGHADVGYLSDLIRSEGASVVHFVPPMLDTTLGLAKARDLTCLRLVMCSGQSLTRSTQSKFNALLPDTQLHNLYGPTEAAVDVTHWRCGDVDPDTGPGVPIGCPIANVTIYILDEALTPVPQGVPGHLYIGGIALARGYLNRPDLTAGAFVPDPFGPPGARMYRSGDRARHLPDGAVEYLGRSDDQIKLRGVRIEPGEIEAAIRSCGISEVVVAARAGKDGEPELIAWLADWDGDTPGLRASLSKVLPLPMIPQHFVTIAALPLTPNGKVDRRALPASSPQRTLTQTPRTETELALARLWSDLLAVERVDRHDNFFQLGGHSLSLLRMLALVQRELGVRVSLRTFMAAPDLAGLALAIDGIRDMVNASASQTDSDTDSQTETILL